MARPRRLDGVSYVGAGLYFLTFCVSDRRAVFVDPLTVSLVMTQFRRTAEAERFAILAYCLMPDHVHLLTEANAETSDLCHFVKMAKQRSGGAYSRQHRRPLWQAGYYERILRADEDASDVARYILNNPLRAGLVRDIRDYPFVGSDKWTLDELLGSLR